MLSSLYQIYRAILLRHAVSLVPVYGFTRQALGAAALNLPRAHGEPLTESAITALFGPGDEARKTLAWAWLEEGRNSMRGQADAVENSQKLPIPISTSLKRRLRQAPRRERTQRTAHHCQRTQPRKRLRCFELGTR